MPSFGKTSEKRLSECHDLLQLLFRQVVRTYDCSILVGHRNEALQNRAVSEGLSRIPWPDSQHNQTPSLAVDVAPYYAHRDPHIDWDDTEGFYHFGGYVKGIAQSMAIPIRWGGDWDSDGDLHDQQLMDLVHFELRKEVGG